MITDTEICDVCEKPCPAADLFSEQPCGQQVCRGCLDAYLAGTAPHEPQAIIETGERK